MVYSKTTWFCGKCRKQFKTQEEAQDHEDSHYNIKGIIDHKYTDKAKAPEVLQVEIELGEGGDVKDVYYQLVREGWGAK